MSLNITKIIIKTIRVRWKKRRNIGNHMNLKRKILSKLQIKLYRKRKCVKLKEVDLISLLERTDPRADNLLEGMLKNQFNQ
jgi:hypothetical protein